MITLDVAYLVHGTVSSKWHCEVVPTFKDWLLRYSIFLQNLRARISPPWSARSYINLESSPYFPVSTWIGFAYYIVLLRDETSSSVFCLSYPDMMWKIINWIRDPISIIFHEGSNKRGCLCLAQKKGQLINIDEGHLFMRCFCSSNCSIKRTTLICLIWRVWKHFVLNGVWLTSQIPRTKLRLTSLSSNTGVSIVSAPWRLKVEMIMSKTWQIFLNTCAA